ncbi:hypothetical protein [Brevundimonas subvibrioides]|uniref:Ankyrin n=1 Tax=Brevundimonas subvibrioides (strain ATCC 15264 / DSM 4735 / LMG 14903 / NBRC 16000 / CB 81) TaxID=633149 RepID=D9QJ38_BRESC|nr:hypothetical protein [Brevundimonas subvibrioides]ADK99562.1 ankyrin [Brevundimonas subvibrioides ATCC 15264]
MTPQDVRADHTLRAAIACGRCNRSRSLRVGAIPRRWQDTDLGRIPFRCFECGERPNRIQVERGTGPRHETVWAWALKPEGHPAGV